MEHLCVSDPYMDMFLSLHSIQKICRHHELYCPLEFKVPWPADGKSSVLHTPVSRATNPTLACPWSFVTAPQAWKATLSSGFPFFICTAFSKWGGISPDEFLLNYCFLWQHFTNGCCIKEQIKLPWGTHSPMPLVSFLTHWWRLMGPKEFTAN